VGKAMTVLGPVDPDELGVTLMHEHLFIDLRAFHPPHARRVTSPGRSEPVLVSDDFPASDLLTWEADLELASLRQTADLKPLADNWVLNDERLAIEEAREVSLAGGRTIVDLTSRGLKRDPEALRRVSVATGLNVVMGSGWYQKVFHPVDMDRRTVEELTKETVRDIIDGVGDTGIRAGIVGEVGVNGGPITPNEVKSIRSAARASRLTGAALNFHEAGQGLEKMRTLDVAEQEGADLGRVVISHCDKIASDMGLMLALLERGVTLEFDSGGRTSALTPSVTTDVVQTIPALIEAGHLDGVVISQDVCTKINLKRFGGMGYSWVLETLVPRLLQRGLTEGQIRTMLVETPKRLLTFAEPRG